ncbi:hypothetical protein PQX77_016238 [Marasmius sp. AFHP31]|nr:hypothetical protein PQX77_016238 [Marasmius sp. AFHP31]
MSATEIGRPLDLLPTVTLIAGIAPALMIVRSRVFEDSHGDTGALSTMRFDLGNGVVTTSIAGHAVDRATRDLESHMDPSTNEVGPRSGSAQDDKAETNVHAYKGPDSELEKK